MFASSGWICCENTSLVSQTGCLDSSHAEHACACRRLTCTGYGADDESASLGI
jgi:hypothetical protein